MVGNFNVPILDIFHLHLQNTSKARDIQNTIRVITEKRIRALLKKLFS